MMYSTKGVLGLAAALTIMATLSACSSSPSPVDTGTAAPSDSGPVFNQEAHDLLPQAIQDAGVLKVGVIPDTPPWTTKPENEFVGLVPELATATGVVLGVDVELVPVTFAGIVAGLQSQQIDVGWTLMTISAEREQTLSLVSYMRTSSDFIVAAGNPKGIEGIDDSLCGTIIGASRGSLYIAALEAQSTKCSDAGEDPIQIDQFDDAKSAILNVQSGKGDAYIGVAGVLRSIAGGSNGTFEVVGASLFPGYIGAATVPESGPADALALALQDLEKDGTYGDILTAWDIEGDALTADQIVVNGIGSGVLK